MKRFALLVITLAGTGLFTLIKQSAPPNESAATSLADAPLPESESRAPEASALATTSAIAPAHRPHPETPLHHLPEALAELQETMAKAPSSNHGDRATLKPVLETMKSYESTLLTP